MLQRQVETKMIAKIFLFIILSWSRADGAQTKLSLLGKTATQSETWSDRVAGLAIDGNVTSFSVSASPSNSAALGWWEVDLGGNYQISKVSLTASFEDYNAKYLQNFSIWLLDSSRTKHLCHDYASSVHFAPSETKSFDCPSDQFLARYIRVARTGGEFRPDGMSLAEVEAFVGAPEKLTEDNSTQASGWSKIDTSNSATAHCNTWGKHYSELAIDNDPSTWSVCCLVCDDTNITGPGWWQIDLGRERPIAGVEIISSPDEYNANYLQNLIGAVSSTNTTNLNESRICFSFPDETYIAPVQNLTFRCSAVPTWGRYLFLIRDLSSAFRVDALGFAEIKIFEAFPPAPVTTLKPTSKPPAQIQQGWSLTDLSLVGKSARQSETWSDRVANMAIDGNVTSFSVAASSGNSSALGWWEVDLGSSYLIGEVIITASLEDYNAKYLQNFSILLLDENRTSRLCHQYSSAHFAPSETKTFSCPNDTFAARYVRVARLGGEFRPDGMSIAELEVKVRTPERLTGDNPTQVNEWSRIDTSNSATAHCNTWGKHYSELAIDNDPSTWSVCCLVCDDTNITGPGWWQIDLGSERPIAGVEIISSSDEYNANYLQNLIGAVSSTNTTNLNESQICFSFPDETYIAPVQNLTFRCNMAPTWGRYFFLIRNLSSAFRVDALGLAEIRIFEVAVPKVGSPVLPPVVRPSPILGINELPLVGKKASQSETWTDRVADLAIDGNRTSFSVAASPLNSSALGWWEVDLGGNYQVVEVRITSSYEEFNALYLQNFTIELLSENRTSLTCYDHGSGSSIPPNQTRSFWCNNGSFQTRFLRIARLGGPFRQDGLALAEVQVFVSYNQPVPVRMYDSEVNGYEVPLTGLKTHQTHTWGDHYSWLAIDGDPSTFSVSCLTCDNSLNSGVGWWQIDLGTERPIVGVQLTSSQDWYNSDYLQDIIIALTSWNDTNLAIARVCYDFANSSTVPAGTTLTFKCEIQPTWGRFVLVTRKETAKFRPDALAITEFRVYESSPTSPPLPSIGDTDTGSQTIPRATLSALQSATSGDHLACLALDGNASTFFSAVASPMVSFWSPVAWWQVDLGLLYNVTRVDVTSSLDDAYARHLEGFSIDIYPRSIFEDQYLTGAIQCAYYPSGSYIPPGKTETFLCRAPNYGRYLIIRKVKDNIVVAERLSASEVTIYYA